MSSRLHSPSLSWTQSNCRTPVKFSFTSRSSRSASASSTASSRSSRSSTADNSSISSSSSHPSPNTTILHDDDASCLPGLSPAASHPLSSSSHDSSSSSEPLRGTPLFNHVRHKFKHGLGTLEDLQTFLEVSGVAALRTEQLPVQDLLANMIVMAKWLVDFLHSAETVGAFDMNTSWARTTVRELRTELHCYTWRVMRITTILKDCA